MNSIYLKTNLDYEQAIALSCPDVRRNLELQYREWLYVHLREQLDKHLRRAMAARYRFGVALLFDEIDRDRED